MYILAKHPLNEGVWQLVFLASKSTPGSVIAEFYNQFSAIAVLNFLNNGKQ